MGRQYNKVIKAGRRKKLIKRRKAAIKTKVAAKKKK